MEIYTLVSKPIDHFPIVLYDNDLHRIEGSCNHKYHITSKTCISDLCLSDWDQIPVGNIQFDSFDGFIVLSTLYPIKIMPITAILTVKEKEDVNKIGLGMSLKW